jgi:hypothetical protein
VETFAQLNEKIIGTAGLIFDEILREKMAFLEKNEKTEREKQTQTLCGR